MKYVVVLEIDTGYIDCIHICDNVKEAYGAAYLELSADLDSEKYYITLPERREGDNGFIMEARCKDDDSVYHWATVLFYRDE